MAEVIWAEPAFNDLDAIEDYIALDNPEAARRLVQKIFEHVENLERHATLGSTTKGLKGASAQGLALSQDRRAAVSHLLPRRFRTGLDTSRHAIRAPAQARTTER